MSHKRMPQIRIATVIKEVHVRFFQTDTNLFNCNDIMTISKLRKFCTVNWSGGCTMLPTLLGI